MTAVREQAGPARDRRSRTPTSPASAFRSVLLVLCALLSAVAPDPVAAVVPIVLLVGLAFAIDRVELLRRHPVPTACLEALVAGTAVALTGGAQSPLLPYLLAPGLALGLAGTWRDVLLVTGVSTLGLAGGRVAAGLGARTAAGSLDDFTRDSALWVALGLAFGLVAGWAQRITAAGAPAAGRYVEARALLEQLRSVTRRLPGGLDLTSSAQVLLEQCSEQVASQRSAVLVQPGPGGLVPAAVRGTTRVPWREPLSQPGPLQRAWDSGLPVVDRRSADRHGRRRGSTLVVVPLSTGDAPFGLLVLEAYDENAFLPSEVDRLAVCAAEGALRIETALLFEEVRSTVTVEERDRLAREMHDGVAQELAFVGYQLDDLRLQAAKVDDALAERMSDVRKDLTRLISDIRLSITDLKTSVTHDRGLGAAITGYVRAVGSGGRVAVHVSLQESSFRLPGEAEVLLFQVTQAVAQDVRRTGQARNLWVTLRVDPPSARLTVEHDGADEDGRELDLAAFAEAFTRLGGWLTTDPRPEGGVRVEAVLEGSGRDGQRPARR